MKKKSLFCLMCLLITVTFLFVGCNTMSNYNGSTPPNSSSCSHSYNKEVISATCSAQGYTYYECSKCGENYKDTYVSEKGHSFVEGERNYYCSVCNVSECEGFSFQQTTMYNGENCYVIMSATSEALVNGKLETPRKYESLPVRYIAPRAFSEIADSIKILVIHDNIKTIYENLFNGTSIWDSDLGYECPIETVVFDSGCSNMYIDSNAFYNCTKLNDVNISKGMVEVCYSDGAFSADGGNGEYLFKNTPYFENKSSKKNGLYYVADLLLHANPNEISDNISIEYGTVAISAATFGNTSIKSVTIPKSVKYIGNNAFYGCSSLEKITFNGTKEEFQLIEIEAYAFSGIKAKQVQCTNGVVTSYYCNDWYHEFGE